MGRTGKVMVWVEVTNITLCTLKTILGLLNYLLAFYYSPIFQLYPILKNSPCYQNACLRGFIITSITFVRLFPAVCFHVSPQSLCSQRCIITLVTFVWLFPSVCFHMFPQIGCISSSIVTYITFVWLFPGVCLHMPPQITCSNRSKVTLVAFIWLFSTALCVFKCLLKLRVEYVA